MSSSHHRCRIHRNLVTACALGCLLAGCTVVGPSAIRSGRLAYNEAITETNNQQLLMSVIYNRYDERSNLLAVASVTANVRVVTNTGIELGVGDSENYVGNLVPFGASVVYEENPTISYTPVEGEQYSANLFSPVPLTALAQLAGTLADPAYIYTTLVSSVNGIHNPDFLFPSVESDPRFERFVLIMTTLTRAGRLHWVENQQDQGNFSVIIDHYAPAYAAMVSELLDLVGLPAPDDRSAQVILPVVLALDGRDSGGIGIVTRSVYSLVEILSAAIEVPEEDQRNGVAASYPAPGLAGKDLRVRRSKARPEQAAVAVNHRDGWFYIDETDQATKRYFRLMGLLWSVAIAEGARNDSSTTPVLTVPVAR
jgi:hypothetical protein